MAELQVILVHELSHAHDFLNTSPDEVYEIYGSSYNYTFESEKRAFHLEAKFVREVDSHEGVYYPGYHSFATGFTNHVHLLTNTNFGGAAYNAQLEALARLAANMTQ